MTSLPYPATGVHWLDKNSSAGRRAVAEFNLVVGYDIRTVFKDDWWRVGQRELERPDVLLTAEGVRAMARFAPNPRGPEVAEQIIAQGRQGR